VFLEHAVPMCRQQIDSQEWQDHGGCDLGEIGQWSDRACGVACLRMILLAHQRPAPPLTELLKLGVGQGALTERGWLHARIAALATSLGVPGTAEAVPAEDLTARLKDGLLIASITFQFPQDGRLGGNLVVLRGYEREPDRADPLILFRDPSGSATPQAGASRTTGSG
jgi:hypothetical protein